MMCFNRGPIIIMVKLIIDITLVKKHGNGINYW
jgi:hypothetical protein